MKARGRKERAGTSRCARSGWPGDRDGLGALLDHPLVAERYFFPRPAPVPSPLWVDAGDARLACALHPTDAPDPLTIVHFHGNGEVVADWLEGGFPEAVASALGCNLFLAEYRGYGMSTGEPRLGRMLDDVEAIVRAAGAPPGRLVLFGRSVGSIFALEGAARFPTVAGLVLESGIADVLERLLLRLEPAELGATADELAAAVAARLDHRAKLAAYPGPVLVMHARHDGLVPASHGERLAAWAAGPAILKLFDRGDHNSILAANARAYLEALAELVALAGGSPRA
ncbi:MAG TPA: alpha/beta hydrolase [Anaeromyxobacter sp.]|nr:alpha/beta hydrolase [Anaeromyxobacter sp.]